MRLKVALVGNPNTGKSSLFNALTGLKQHVGNFPGVTVDKKSGVLKLDSKEVELIDLPGTYSLYPRSKDEEVVYDILNNSQHPDYPDMVCVIVDTSNLERNLLLFTQVYDLGFPTLLVLNMSDVAHRRGITFNQAEFLQTYPEVTIVATNARIGLGLDRLKSAIFTQSNPPERSRIELLPKEDIQQQVSDTEKRYSKIKEVLRKVVTLAQHQSMAPRISLIDRFVVHPLFGYGIFIVVLFVLFQLIFSLASYPMDWIDTFFGSISTYFMGVLPNGLLTDLFVQGILPGIGGVVIFLPQICLLFFFISLLEETGYMARVVFIMDRLMRPFGLNGKSVVPLISSSACAIPGIMSSRTITNWKERLITIMVAPLISCSARIPVFTLLIALVIPSRKVLGVFNLQGITFFGLYTLGLLSALIFSFVLKKIISTNEPSVLLMELPAYKLPRWNNVGINVVEKAKVFLVGAGKIIIAISIVLWALGTFGPEDRRKAAIAQIEPALKNARSQATYQKEVRAVNYENSYIGILGKSIEPIIAPLGYDWKIGISLLTSFAAREVFVGSMATIYSVEDDGSSQQTLMQKLKTEKRKDGSSVYSLATGLSLMVFYVYAMQCMATFAVVKRETNSWKWPFIQLFALGGIAYLVSWLTYQLFS